MEINIETTLCVYIHHYMRIMKNCEKVQKTCLGNMAVL